MKSRKSNTGKKANSLLSLLLWNSCVAGWGRWYIGNIRGGSKVRNLTLRFFEAILESKMLY
jgi:hypothetical protein